VGVISLPAGVFQPYSGVKTSILWLDKVLAKKTDKILFVKIENDGFDLGAQRRAVKESDLPGALQRVLDYKNQIVFGKLTDFELSTHISLVERNEISLNGDYNLSGGKYKIGEKKTRKWDFVQIGEVATIINGRAYNQNELLDSGPVPVLRVGNFFSNRDWYYSNLELPEDKYCVEGDLLYAWSASFGPRIWEGPKAIYHYHIWKIICSEKINKKFLYYLLDWDTENIKSEGGRGIAMIHITKSGMEERKIPLPPLSIQKEIVTEIESYQKIIDGARQVVENYKPRIDIDPGWEMVELGEVCELIGGGTPSKQVESYWKDGTIKWISSKHINNDGAVVGYELISNDGLKNSSSKIVPKGSTIVITRVSVGKIAFADDYYAVNQDLTGLRVKDLNTLNEKFLFYSSRGLSSVIDQNAQGLGVRGINREFLASLKIPLPDKNIQDAIVLSIEKEKEMVNSTKGLLASFEQKIRDRIAKVWGE
jgi:type I restriction enzyme M protein